MFNSLRPSDAYMRHETKPSLLRIVACRLAGTSHHLKQCGILRIGPWGTNFNNILVEIHHFTSRKCVWIWRLQKIASNLSRPHCVISLVTISTTTKFGKMSDELILMRGELISFSHTRWRHSCQRLCLLRYPLGFQWSPSTWVFFYHYGHMPSYYQKATDPNGCLSQSYNRISYNISPGQFHIPGNIWRVILGFEVGRVLVWYCRLDLLLSLHYSIV